MLTCRELAEQADAFLDKDLGLGQRLRIRLHMLMCCGCNRFMGQMRTTRSLITAEAGSKIACNDHETVDAEIDSILDAFDNTKQSGDQDGPATQLKD